MSEDSLDSIRVLHVDDEPDFSSLSATYLARQDDRLSVTTAASASAGLDHLNQTAFDCVVSDFDMPEQNGIQFLEAVRDDYPDLPFILYTGKGSEEVASDAISAGVTDYLQKETGTSQYEVLANRIRNAVEHRQASQTIQETKEWSNKLLEYSSDYLLVVDNSGVVSYISPSVERVLGYSPEELIGADAFDFAHPADIDTATEAFAEILERPNDEVRVEFRAKHAAGGFRWQEVRGRNLLDDPVIEGILVNVRDITDRKDREQEIEELYGRISDAFFGLDEDWCFTHINEHAHDIINPEGRDLEGTYVWEEFPAATERKFKPKYEQAMYNQETVSFEEYYPDPLEAWFEVRAYPSETGLSVYFRDITERKEREDRYSAIFNQTYQFTGLLEPDGTLIEANETALEFGGLDRADVIGKKMWDAYWFQQSAETRAQAKRAVERAADGEFVRDELRVQGADAAEIIIDFSVRPITDEQGTVTLLIPEGRDITERRAYERELESKTRRLDAILENTTTPMFMKADDGKYLFVNHGYRALFGLEDAEIVGQTDYDIHPSAMADEVTENDQLVIERGETVETEERITVEGSERIFLSTKVPIYDTGERSDPNTPVAMFGVASDITELKARERELQYERDRLDEFASVVSHDLRNPLRVAQGNLGLAREDGDLEALEGVARSLERMDTLIDDLLTLAIAGDSVGETEQVEVGALAAGCWQQVENGTATVAIDAEGSIRADESRLRQILENLLRNAIEHGGEDVTVRVGDLSNGFYVEDDGPGIPPEVREKVLEPGYSTREDGTGFGLNIVRDIAEAHDWTINITESREGGARFEFRGVATT